MALAGETKSETIAGKHYSTTTLDAATSLPIMMKLLRLIPRDALTRMLGESDDEDPDSWLNDPGLVLDVIQHIAEKDKELDLTTLAKDLLATTTCQEVRIGDNEVPGNVVEHFGTHFAGDFGHLLSVCIWVAGVNFFGS